VCLVQKPLQPLQNTLTPHDAKSDDFLILMDKRIDELKEAMLKTIGEAVKEAADMATDRTDILKKCVEGSLMVLKERVDTRPMKGMIAESSQVQNMQRSMQTKLERVENDPSLCKVVLAAKPQEHAQLCNS